MDPDTKTSFQINPLDINIVKIQFNLIRKLEEENDIISESYSCTSPVLNVTELNIILESLSQKSAKLFAYAIGKENDSKEIVFIEDNKEQVIEYIKSTNLFEDCKKFIRKNFNK